MEVQPTSGGGCFGIIVLLLGLFGLGLFVPMSNSSVGSMEAMPTIEEVQAIPTETFVYAEEFIPCGTQITAEIISAPSPSIGDTYIDRFTMVDFENGASITFSLTSEIEPVCQ